MPNTPVPREGLKCKRCGVIGGGVRDDGLHPTVGHCIALLQLMLDELTKQLNHRPAPDALSDAELSDDEIAKECSVYPDVRDLPRRINDDDWPAVERAQFAIARHFLNRAALTRPVASDAVEEVALTFAPRESITTRMMSVDHARAIALEAFENLEILPDSRTPTPQQVQWYATEYDRLANTRTPAHRDTERVEWLEITEAQRNDHALHLVGGYADDNYWRNCFAYYKGNGWHVPSSDFSLRRFTPTHYLPIPTPPARTT